MRPRSRIAAGQTVASGVGRAIGAGAILALLAFSPGGAQQAPPEVEALITEALENNRLLAAERYSEAAARAGALASGRRLFPSLDFESRVSEQRGGLNLGDFVNPAYSALNDLNGSPRFPVDLDLTLPQRHDTRLRLTQPIYAPALWAGRDASAHQADAAGLERRTMARQLVADVQVAYYSAAAAARAVEIQRSAVELTAEAERMATRLVDTGTATPDGVLRARAERTESEQRLLEAETEARAALWALNRLVGRPLEAPLDAVADDELPAQIPVAREEAVERALAAREEISALGAAVQAAEAGVRAASASLLPSVAVALDYGAQGNEVSFDRDSDYLVGSVILSWNVFRSGVDGARRQEASAQESGYRERQLDARDRVHLDVLQAYDAAVTARAAITAARDREAAATRAHELVERRFQEGLVPNYELIDARRARTAAELNLSLTLYGYASRLANLERAAALRTID